MTEINVGNDKETIIEINKTIVNILTASVDQATIQMALQAFSSVAEIKNVSIEGCNIDINKEKCDCKSNVTTYYPDNGPMNEE